MIEKTNFKIQNYYKEESHLQKNMNINDKTLIFCHKSQLNYYKNPTH